MTNEPIGVAPLRLAPTLDAEVLAVAFARERRLQIADFLVAEDAERLAQELVTSDRWSHIISTGAQVYEIPRASYDAMPAGTRATIEAAIIAEAAHGFRFRYDAVRVPDGAPQPASMPGLLCAFAELMSGPAALALITRITRFADLSFADAQATRYRAGDFLTRHDDDIVGKNRRLAYVLGLTRHWQPEWGGLLLFNGTAGTIVETIVPRFNTLSLFAVPQPHSVSAVAAYAMGSRLSITGWLRSGPRPET